jgi:hypothetical protein
MNFARGRGGISLAGAGGKKRKRFFLEKEAKTFACLGFVFRVEC